MTAAPGELDAAIGRDLEAGLGAMGLDTALAAELQVYLALLDRWNRAYNLTAIRAPEQMVTHHLLDSLAAAPFVRGARLADIGSGAGLPGIPLAVLAPERQVTLIDANGKKTRFLREAVRTLHLDNARVAESRIEALDEPGAYDAITARALATLPLILQLGGHLLKPGGHLLAMKGARPDDEIAALPSGWRLQNVHALTVPGLAAERHLVVVARE